MKNSGKSLFNFRISGVHISAVGIISVDIYFEDVGLEIFNFTIYEREGKLRIEIPENFCRFNCRDFPTVRFSDNQWITIRGFIEEKIKNCKWLMNLLKEEFDCTVFSSSVES